MSKPQAIYGLIGRVLGHSFSQDFFNKKFASEGIDARYINFEIEEIGQLNEVLAQYPQLRGLNVTIPYKEQVIPYLDDVDEQARKIGAVNVIKFIGRGAQLKLKGYNSDVVGFSDSIAPLLGSDRKRALILGTGGAAKAVAAGLEGLGVEVQPVSRSSRPGVLTYDDLTEEVMRGHTVIVNTTPLGMYPHTDEAPPIPYDMLTERHLCYDLIYNPDTTLFMQRAAAHGAETKNGLEMLLLQAFVSWQIWNSPA